MCYQDDMLCPEMASHRLCGSTWEMGRRQGLARPDSIQAVQAMHSHRHDIDVVSDNDAMQRTQGSAMMRMVDCCGAVESGNPPPVPARYLDTYLGTWQHQGRRGPPPWVWPEDGQGLRLSPHELIRTSGTLWCSLSIFISLQLIFILHHIQRMPPRFEFTAG
jgi:hypothetical protein